MTASTRKEWKSAMWTRALRGRNAAAGLLLHLEVAGLEGAGQQLGHAEGLAYLPAAVGDEHHGVEPELGQHLAAGAAGRAAVVSHERQHFELALALRDRLEDGQALGADAIGIGGVLDVDPG